VTYPDLESPPEEEEGGPKKTFWAHLEDLRKVLIRCTFAIVAALVICLLMDEKLMRILEYPLKRMEMFDKPHSSVTLQLGETKLGPIKVDHDQFSAVPAGSTARLVFNLEAVKIGDEQVLALKPVSADTSAESSVGIRLHNLGPAEAFFVAFHVAMYGAVILSSPFWLFFIGQFMLPALHVRERKVLFIWLGWSSALFMVGVLMTYFVLLPVSLRASVEYSELLGFSAADWRAEEYISFVTKFLLGMGIGFQFPVLILILVKMGLLTHTTLAKYRRHVCVLSFFLGAILTTPEVITQVAMAIPLYLLYEISIWIAWYWDRKKRKAEKAAAVS